MNANRKQNEEYLKTRIEQIGFADKIVNALLKANVRTVRGFVSRGKDEIRKILGLPAVEIETIFQKIENPTFEDRNENQQEIQDDPVDTPQVLDLGEDEDIVGTLSEYFGYSKEDVTAHSRKQDLVRVRDFIVYLLREYGDMSYPAIGRLLGGRDHTTIIHSFNKTRKAIRENPELEKTFANIKDKVTEIKERKLRLEKEIIPEILSSAEGRTRIRVPVYKEIPERNMKVLELWREGLTLANIGNVVGVSRERVRQIVVGTVRQIAVNESIEKGIVMDSDVLAEEEAKKRKQAQEAKRTPRHVHKNEAKRWSRYYLACKSCGTTSIPHVRKGLCEQCIGQFRGNRRESIIEEHGNKCDTCGRSRSEANVLFGRDFYITKNREVFCKGCFLRTTGKKLSVYRYERSKRG